ncbi:MAG: hypothetical protein KC900_11940 [Candidatus Omnitrophica bacterium]|nr:hypothetical protein [Candidatus Omnitrophota bacterium]
MENLPLIPGQDYLIDPQGRFVFTREYLLRRGFCCESGCRNCPYEREQQDMGESKIP